MRWHQQQICIVALLRPTVVRWLRLPGRPWIGPDTNFSAIAQHRVVCVTRRQLSYHTQGCDGGTRSREHHTAPRAGTYGGAQLGLAGMRGQQSLTLRTNPETASSRGTSKPFALPPSSYPQFPRNPASSMTLCITILAGHASRPIRSPFLYSSCLRPRW